MKTMKVKLFYTFKIEAKGCAPGNTYWCGRHQCIVENTTKENLVAIAGRLAGEYLGVTESGIRVRFMGIQRADDHTVTPMNNFTLTVERNT